MSTMDNRPTYVMLVSAGTDSVVFKTLFPSPLAQEDNTTTERNASRFHHKLSTQSAVQDGTSTLLVLAVYLFPLVLHRVNQMSSGMESHVIQNLLGMFATQASDGTETAVLSMM